MRKFKVKGLVVVKRLQEVFSKFHGNFLQRKALEKHLVTRTELSIGSKHNLSNLVIKTAPKEPLLSKKNPIKITLLQAEQQEIDSKSSYLMNPLLIV